jgi:hypothetical protein
MSTKSTHCWSVRCLWQHHEQCVAPQELKAQLFKANCSAAVGPCTQRCAQRCQHICALYVCCVWRANTATHSLKSSILPEVYSNSVLFLHTMCCTGAQGVDPGFFHQMRLLEETLAATLEVGRTEPTATSMLTSAASSGSSGANSSSSSSSSWLGGAVVCAGVSCLDLQLCGSTLGASLETINTFQEAK